MLKTAKEVIATGNVSEMVDFAVECDREIKATTKELEVAKVALRDEGSKKAALSGESNVTIQGSIGSAQVVFPKESPSVKKGRSIAELLSVLSAEDFAALFVTEYKPSAEFAERLASMTPAQRAAVGNIVELKTATARVNLK